MLIVLKKIFKLSLKFLVFSFTDIEKGGSEREREEEREKEQEREREGERERDGVRKGGGERGRETNTCLSLNFCKKFFLDRFHNFLRENNNYIV